MYPPREIQPSLHLAGRHELSISFHITHPAHISHINCFCQSHKQFRCPPNGLPCHHSFSKRGIHTNDRWGVKTTWNVISCVFPKHSKMISLLFILSYFITSQQTTMSMCRNPLHEDDNHEERWFLREVNSVSLSPFFCLSLSLLLFLTMLPMMMWQVC